MTPEIAVGLIGMGGALGGALLGGAATFAGVVYQQQRQAQLTFAQRQTEITDRALEDVVTQAQELKRLALAQPHTDFEWTPQMGECVEAIRVSTLRVPYKELRETIDAACMWQFGAASEITGGEQGFAEMPGVKVVVMSSQLQQVVGAYLRDDSKVTFPFMLTEAKNKRKEFYEDPLRLMNASGEQPTL
ncbi:hypothetical protein [Nocardiopsis alba]|jgi:hypothetical protein|uniref:hypothetical protein n=1 Tax=Nocardiopsis alba TaxID=53437 RepID=UPI001267D719|nr:hypothetical protein [Nocardiopsis alba]